MTTEEMLQRFKEKADALGYRLVAKADTELWQVTFRIPPHIGTDFHDMAIFVEYNSPTGRSRAVCQIVDGPKRL